MRRDFRDRSKLGCLRGFSEFLTIDLLPPLHAHERTRTRARKYGLPAHTTARAATTMRRSFGMGTPVLTCEVYLKMIDRGASRLEGSLELDVRERLGRFGGTCYDERDSCHEAEKEQRTYNHI